MRNVILLVLCLGSVCAGDIYMLGDLDGGHYDGPLSADHVYVDADHMQFVKDRWYAYTGKVWYRNRITGFDSWMYEQNTPFSFAFPERTLTEAWLTMVIAPTKGDFRTDVLTIEQENYHRLGDLGWDQSSGFRVGTVDLMPYASYLDDGLLNLEVGDDSCVDFAMLTLNQTPWDISALPVNKGGVFPPYDPVPRPPLPPNPNPVPVPSAAILGILGLGTAGVRLRRKQHA